MKDNIRRLKCYQPDTSDAPIRLDANENALDFSSAFMEDIFMGIDGMRFNRYPDTDAVRLRKKVAGYVGAKPENVIAGNGSDEIIRLIMESFVDKGETVVYHDPTFSMYDISCRICGGVSRRVPPLEDFRVDIFGIIKAANESGAKVIFLCNPNNPTGGTISREEIISVIEATQAIVVVDEAYFEFFGETVVDLITTYDRLIVLRTMSKAFGLAAARVGFGIADRPIIDVLNKVRPPYNLNSMSQLLARIYLDNAGMVLRAAEDTKVRRDALWNGLKKFDFLTPYPSRSNFIYLKTDCLEQIRAVVAGQIALRYFGEHYFRVSVGTNYENEMLLDLLRQVQQNENGNN